MNSYDYPLEKLTATVETLAETDGPLRERLFSAYMSQGDRTPAADGGDHAPDLAERIAKLHSTLRDGAPDQGEGSIRASIDLLNDEQVRETVREILALFHVVTELYWLDRGARP